MSNILNKVLILLLAMLPMSAVADGAASGMLWREAQAMELAQAPYWQQLLHLRHSLTGRTVSDVISPRFFLSPNGQEDAAAELKATIEAFFEPVGEDPNQHPQCRFPARYRWLQQRLSWPDVASPHPVCERYLHWARPGRFRSVSLVFATGYFSNPASYYGHILLRFDSGDVPDQGLLEESLNFGALVPEQELPLVYVMKGLFGGYEAAFSGTQFYRHNHDYAESELRDLWVYVLDLRQDEVDQLAAHSWELLQARFDYYFLQQNCGYRMAELLETVVDQPLREPVLPWSIPSAVFDRLMQATHDGHPLVRQIDFIPSRLSRMQADYRTLDAQQRRFVQDWVAQRADFDGAHYGGFDRSQKVAVVDTLLDYVEFRRAGEPEDATYRQLRMPLLAERASLPPGPIKPVDLEGKAPPHDGALPGMFRLGAVQRAAEGMAMLLQIRPAYFDRLSLDAAKVPYSTLAMMDTELHYQQGRVRLRRLDIARVENLNVAQTPLPGDGGWAWRVHFGLDSHDLACADCLVGQVSGGMGRAHELTQGLVGYVMADVFTQTPYAGSGNLGRALNVGGVLDVGRSWKSSLELGRRIHFNGRRDSVPVVQWRNRFGGERDWDVWLGYERNTASQWQVSIARYW
jgi:hypothetical protein